jgi:hypothetical protein
MPGVQVKAGMGRAVLEAEFEQKGYAVVPEVVDPPSSHAHWRGWVSGARGLETSWSGRGAVRSSSASGAGSRARTSCRNRMSRSNAPCSTRLPIVTGSSRFTRTSSFLYGLGLSIRRCRPGPRRREATSSGRRPRCWSSLLPHGCTSTIAGPRTARSRSWQGRTWVDSWASRKQGRSAPDLEQKRALRLEAMCCSCVLSCCTRQARFELHRAGVCCMCSLVRQRCPMAWSGGAAPRTSRETWGREHRHDPLVP